MATVTPKKKTLADAMPPLCNGDVMTQPEFHERYSQCPDHEKYELVGGTVFMSSPLRWPHATYHVKLTVVFDYYSSHTPGTEAGDNATTILGDEGEPQPDLILRLLAEYGGQSKQNIEEYLEGPPELLAEIAYSTRSLDMNTKLADYKAAGVQEYLVLCIEEQELHWFHFPSAKKIKANRDGIAKSKVFPGLWLDVAALLARDSKRLTEVVQQGLASKEYASFVKRLEKRKRPAEKNN